MNYDSMLFIVRAIVDVFFVFLIQFGIVYIVVLFFRRVNKM